MEPKKRKGSENYYLDWRDEFGQRHRESLGTADKKLAEIKAAQRTSEIYAQKRLGVQREVPFGEALLSYAREKKRDNPRSFERSARYRLKHLQERFGTYNLSQITLGVVEAYLEERLGQVSRATAQRDLITLRAIMNKAYKKELISKKPVFPTFKKLKPRVRWLTREEETRLIACASDHLKPIIMFAVDTGGRLSDVLGLDWENVDMANRRICYPDTKNDEDVYIPLTRRTYAFLVALGPVEKGPVFTFRGKPIKSVGTSFKKTVRKAGLENLRFHDLRHTFASRLVQGGVPMYEVQRLLGHKSPEMTQRYAHLAPDFGVRAVQVLDAFGPNMGTVGREAA